MNKKIVLVCCLLGIIALFVTFGPFFTIWSVNTLFGLQIPMNFLTWVAVLWLMTVLHGIKVTLRKDN